LGVFVVVASYAGENALTIDVEDYFHVAALKSQIPVESWDTRECRVERNVDVLLQMFDDQGVIATFFTLGWVAERYPQVVERIAKQGHEVASHGYSHQLVYKQTPEVFREETFKSKKILENISQQPVRGYRAASYSITTKSLWAIDTLIEAGFEYDSSIFPVHHDLYGIPDFPKKPHVYKGSSKGDIVEFPISSVNMCGYQFPIAGGGYFRLFPYWFSRFGLRKINREGDGFMFYLHPWEVDPEQPRVKNVGWKSTFRHYNNLHKCQKRLQVLLEDFEFTSMENVLTKQGLLKPNSAAKIIEHREEV
jgi:polysaccharide deacetylase family protein (PEP-CTERM system associated)